MERRIIATEILAEDAKMESSLRPLHLEDYVGQEKVKRNLKVYIEAAKERGDSLDHVLFYGPPGLGKTTLAGIIANEMGVNIKVTSGPAIEKPGEMAAILNNLAEGDILFVDEIHRLIDTMEVMDQMIYEIFRKMQDYYKASVKAVLESGVTAEGMDDMDDEAELIFAYAVLKGCRMKALHTEKYEGIVLGVCDKVMSGEIFTGEDTEANDTIISMAALVYSETVRNREYQDYGRGKGGALWS